MIPIFKLARWVAVHNNRLFASGKFHGFLDHTFKRAACRVAGSALNHLSRMIARFWPTATGVSAQDRLPERLPREAELGSLRDLDRGRDVLAVLLGKGDRHLGTRLEIFGFAAFGQNVLAAVG